MAATKQKSGELNDHMKFTLFQSVPPINQKNFYTEYLKNDTQYFSHRQLAENARTVAQAKKAKLADKELLGEAKTVSSERKDTSNGDSDDEDEEESDDRGKLGSKTIVLHFGSSYTRLGLASDPQPKSVPTVIARRDSGPIQSSPMITADVPAGKGMFGDEFEENVKKLELDMRARMRNAKRRMVPNANELVSSFNKRSEYEEIVDHNDPGRLEWTEVGDCPKYITGTAALRIPPASSPPHYSLYWPIRNGVLNEKEYTSREALLGDLACIVSDAVQSQLKILKKNFSEYSLALVVPDLYDKSSSEAIIDLLFREFRFANLLILQESVCATFGAGISSACVVDIGAQCTTVSCVEEGLCIGDSRLNMQYGGNDLTKLFLKQLLRVSFPYRDFDLMRSYDAIFAEELKLKFCSVNEAEAAVQLYQIYQRQPDRQTRKYSFKVYDEQITCTMAYYHPEIFDNEDKYLGRRRLFPPCQDVFEDLTTEPESVIQDRLLYGRSDREPNNIYNVNVKPVDVAPVKAAPRPATVQESVRDDTPIDVDAPTDSAQHDSKRDVEMAIDELVKDEEPAADVLVRDDEYPLIAPLDVAIISSITCACENAPAPDERRRAMCSTILITGAGYNFPHANYYLEERLKALRPSWSSIAILPAPRDMQPETLSWKGMSIFSRIKIATEYWVSNAEYELLGTRTLQQKSLGTFWMG